MSELIICEKPIQAMKVAGALSSKAKKNNIKKVSYYELTKDGKKIFVVSAVGHLFTVTEKDKKAWSYPIFDLEWKPSYEVNKDSAFTKPYFDVIKKVSKECNEFTVACDYDIEGEVIGERILKFICNKDDAKRMKFSTTTSKDLLEAYENALGHIDFGMAEAGLTRHELDWLWGINLSRALTLSIKNSTGYFKIMSIGRVQGPTLGILTKREKEIEAFKPEPYWELELKGNVKSENIIAFHEKDKFWDKKEVDTIYNNVKGKDGKIKSIEKKETKQKAPEPFDLTTLQTEAYRCLGLSPKQTQEIAQNLYVESYISYPRTSSQKLPVVIGYKSIFIRLKRLFNKECEYLLNKKNLRPNEGKKVDPAHPAIYPTGEYSKSLKGKNADLYELIVRRFFATFGDDCVRETVNVEISVNKEIFIARGITTKKEGWHELYGRFSKVEETELPGVSKDENVKVKEIILHSKETQPPKRYTEASIIKELERKNLGTKATRSLVLDSLYQRNYINNRPIIVTDLGKKTIKTLEEFCPDVLDEKLTRKFEKEMGLITTKKKGGEIVLAEAKKFLTKALKHFKENEKKIGEKLSQANIETRDKESFIGKCPKCKEGDLRIRRGKFGLFVACGDYPNCETTFSLPRGLVRPSGNKCKECNYPSILLIIKGKKPREFCINPNCPSKKVDKKLLEVERKCPNCGSILVIKKGVYGSFFACPGYPKCKYIESINKKKV